LRAITHFNYDALRDRVDIEVTNSSKQIAPFTLAVKYTQQAAQFLTDFANASTYEWFDRKWGEVHPFGWTGENDSFEQTQKIIREIWEGKHKGAEASIVANGLGLLNPRPQYADSSLASLIQVSWENGTLWAYQRDLNDQVWLILLTFSARLAVCANRENGCATPYFIRKKPNQKFCSEECALPAQRAFKRRWFREHGEEWRHKWLKKRKRSAIKIRKGR
jgi:hypothetical protein